MFILIDKSVLVQEIAWWWVNDDPHSKPIVHVYRKMLVAKLWRVKECQQVCKK